MQTTLRVPRRIACSPRCSARPVVLNTGHHNRVPTPLDHQPVIRMNRDTLYSAALVDITAGARLTVPDGGERYISAMVVNQDHYINEVFYDPGDYELTEADFDTPYVLVAARTLLDPADPEDVAVANALQDQLRLTAASSTPFQLPEYDAASFTATRQALLQLAKGLCRLRPNLRPARRGRCRASPDRNGCRLGRTARATRLSTSTSTPACPLANTPSPCVTYPSMASGRSRFTTPPGTSNPTPAGSVSINNLTAARDPDGSVTVHFGSGSADRPTPCRSWTDGTTSSASTGRAPRSSAARGRSRTRCPPADRER